MDLVSLSMAKQWKIGTWVLIGTFMYCRNPSNLMSGFSHSYFKYCMYSQQSREEFFFELWLFTQETVGSFVTTGKRHVCYSQSPFTLDFRGLLGPKAALQIYS